jgi:tRNA-dihydrouridine synthase B
MSVTISLAPFMGITSKIYRNSFASHFPGLDRIYAPFISGVHPEKTNISKFSDVLPRSENVLETVPQFVSTDAREVVAIARLLKEQGYEHINWNMGCPFSRIANKKRGCGILPYPDEIKSLLDEIMPVIPLALSVKTRLGYYQTSELPLVIDVLNQYPLKELIIHPRTGTQLYTGNTWLDEFAHCMALSKIPVTFNGDIFHSRRYTELKQMFPEVQSWMIGRGALINPFLAAQIKGIQISDQQMRQAMKNFHYDLFEQLKKQVTHEKRLPGQMKAIWYYMSGVFSNGKDFFKTMKVCQDSKSYLKFVPELLEQPFATDDEIESYWKNELKHVG